VPLMEQSAPTDEFFSAPGLKLMREGYSP